MRAWRVVASLSVLAWTGAAQPAPVRIQVAASAGRIIPQSKGGGGFQRTFRFVAASGRAGHWIRQELRVRGTVFDARGRTTVAHLDVVEYYRVGSSGRAIQADSHYSQFWNHCGGDLTMASTLTYGTLRPVKPGDTIMARSFVLRSCLDAAGKPVTMRKRTTREVIPAESGKRVRFQRQRGSLATAYTYRVRWDARPGRGSRTRPSGAIETGTWHYVLPEPTGHTRARIRPRPIPRIIATR